jgi:hypothetical protein
MGEAFDPAFLPPGLPEPEGLPRPAGFEDQVLVLDSGWSGLPDRRLGNGTMKRPPARTYSGGVSPAPRGTARLRERVPAAVA